MNTRMRLSILIALLLTSWTASAAARGPGPKPHNQDEHGEPAIVHRGSDLKTRPEVRKAAHRRRCHDRTRWNARGGCYRVGDAWYYDDSDAGDAPPAARRTSSGLIDVVPTKPVPTQGNLEVIAPVGNIALKEELIAARRNWLEKKQIFEEASTARARAEYQASQDGGQVDPALIERQRVTQNAAAEAQAAMAPLVERARSAGFSSEVLNLYERSSRGN